MKRCFSFAFVFLILCSVGFVSAQEDVELNAGITPDSAFYFIDEFFDRFGDDISNKEERVAEIREMIKEGKIDAAREALDSYRIYADRLEEEIDPEKKEEAERSAAAIRKVLEELESEIPEEDRDEFYDEILEKEENIVKAVEIADKIKGLCVSLSELDPKQYEEVCKTDDDAPEWQRDLDKELTKEQEKEAKEFFKIMNQCFKTSGTDCECDEISVKPFADKCSVIAPLAAACELENDEEACEKMDRLEEEEPIEDLLPDHLKAVFDSIGGGPESFEDYAPEECIEAGATNEEECEEVMFKLHAPEECVEAGLNDHRDCEKLLFEIHSPPECLEAGLDNHQDCDKLLEDLYEKEDNREFEIHIDCREVEDPDERLKCYDGLIEYSEDFYGEDFYEDDFHKGFDLSEKEKECADECSAENSGWDLVGDDCVCYSPEDFEEYPADPDDYRDEEGYFQDDYEDHEGDFDEPYDEQEEHDEVDLEDEKDSNEDSENGSEDSNGDEDSN